MLLLTATEVVAVLKIWKKKTNTRTEFIVFYSRVTIACHTV